MKVPAQPAYDDALLDELGRIFMDLALQRLLEEVDQQAELNAPKEGNHDKDTD